MPPKSLVPSTRNRSAPSAPNSRQKATPETAEETQASNQQRLEQLASLENRKGQLSQDLRKVEGQIYELESRYLDSCNPQGNALKGYEGLLAKQTSHSRKPPARPTERLFSGSSVSRTGR
ncbi:hypothetical protein WJX74_010822 [Apatococcus lobatus]|uniref:Chromatin modification-related protein EAF6 n=1 Tax=Apatococcus lobatus TaxID=904363 RepID=A0AAW1RR87_9CHLO